MHVFNIYPRDLLSAAFTVLLGIVFIFPNVSNAEVIPLFHFESICRSDPAENKNKVSVILHDDFHNPLADVTINALWTYVDYRQNRAVFRYKPDSCTTNNEGVCRFNGGGGRARWQLTEVVGYDLGDPAFDAIETALCPNTFMIDFW